MIIRRIFSKSSKIMAITSVPLTVILIILGLLDKVPLNQVVMYCVALNILAFIALSKKKQQK